MKRVRAVLLGLAIGVAAFAGAVLWAKGRTPVPAAAAPPGSWADPFDSLEAWTAWSEGDFREKRADAVGGRLRLGAATVGTDDRTVKTVGVRSAKAVPLGPGTSLRATLDWNGQANGSYLSSALVLAPEGADGNPLSGRDWIKVEYVGVPPGRNGRLVVGRRAAGRDLPLFTEGWPKERREGRPIGRQEIELRLDAAGLTVLENGAAVFSAPERPSFPAARLHLLLSSHSNYPMREVLWDDVQVRVP